MDTQHDANKEFFALFADELATAVPLSASDLAAISIESNSGEEAFRKTIRSTGSIRFTGHGITGHQGDAEGLFSAGNAFVHLVTAVGSALSGARSKISENAARLTRLNLDASPEPGSVIFNLVPAIEPETELRPDGELMDDKQQLVDQAISEVERLMNLDGPATGDSLAQSLEQLGPIAARSLRTFVATTEHQHLDVDFAWRQPLQGSRRWKLSVGDSSYVRSIIDGRKLDDEPVRLTGYWKTVSMSDSWILVDDEYGTIAVNVGDIKGAPWQENNPEIRVQIDAVMIVKEAPGKLTRRSFKAKKIIKIAN